MAKAKLAPRRGRPRKFTVPARPVTLTLPEHVIRALAAIDGDLSRAVVRLAQPEVAKQPHPPAELATFGPRSVIVVNPSRTLDEQPGVALVHLPDGRALISFDQSTTIAGLELMMADVLEDEDLSTEDREIFETIAGILRTARRSPHTTLAQRNIIVVESKRRSRNGGTA
jgi:hypothetical protein